MEAESTPGRRLSELRQKKERDVFVNRWLKNQERPAPLTTTNREKTPGDGRHLTLWDIEGVEKYRPELKRTEVLEKTSVSITEEDITKEDIWRYNLRKMSDNRPVVNKQLEEMAALVDTLASRIEVLTTRLGDAEIKIEKMSGEQS